MWLTLHCFIKENYFEIKFIVKRKNKLERTIYMWTKNVHVVLTISVLSLDFRIYSHRFYVTKHGMQMWLNLIFNININRFCYFLQRLQKILLVSVLQHGLFAFYRWKCITLQRRQFSPCLRINTYFEFLTSKTCELLLQRCANEIHNYIFAKFSMRI